MSAGDVTQGVRRYDVAPWDLLAGEYQLDLDAHGAIKHVWVCLPNGIGPCELHTWSPVIHEDGTVTLSPSILDRQTGWHGYLERGVWREV